MRIPYVRANLWAQRLICESEGLGTIFSQKQV
jgi:hypothetical protein